MNRKINILSLILGGLLFSWFCYAQETSDALFESRRNQVKFLNLSGTVKSYDGEPIPKAIVLIPEIGKSTETEKGGTFEMRAIPPGKYHLEVFATGFMDFISDHFKLDKNRLTFNITLMKKLSREIVVTATRTPKLYAEVPVKTEIITSREIDQKQATQLAESLSLTTGVRVENNCQNCNFTQVRINGMEGKYSQILVDNSPIFSSMIGVYGLEQIPSEMLNRIEVVKGGGSALYGGNAVAGVINVLTKEPMSNGSTMRLHQEFNHGKPYTDMGFRSSLVSTDGNTKAFLFANYKRRDPVDLNEDDISEIGRLRGTNFGLNVYNYFPGLNGKVKLGFFKIAEDRRGGDLFGLPPHEAHIAEWINSDLLNLSLDWNHYLTKRFYYNVSISHVHAERDSYYGSDQDLNAYGSTKNPVTFLNLQTNYQKGSHLISAGVQYKSEKIEDKALGYGREIKDEYNELGFFLQDDFKLSKKISFLAGLRLSKHTLIQNALVTPRMSFLLNPTKNISWRTTFSTGYRAPQVFDEDLHITQVGGEGMIIENSPDLKEEKSYSLTTGIDFGKEIGKNLIQFSIEGFTTLLTNAFILDEKEYSAAEKAMVFQRINGSNAKVYGLSTDFGLRFNPYFSFTAGLTIQKSRLDEPEPDFNSRDFFRTPNSYGYARLNYENKKVFDIDLSLEYTGKMKIPHFAGYIEEDRLETGPTFWVINAKMKKQFHFSQSSQVGIFIGAYNLLDSYQKDLDKGFARDSGYVYGPARPRSFFTGFEFSF
ncbi:MAG: TonB-dependent receptor [Candidatus Aminicenantes bacterium]|nr:TonB-dependent receptor [Candidatus Aminicenantes bacterium]